MKYTKQFDQIFDDLIGHEGGFSDDPRDRGNWTGGRRDRGKLKGTNWGISAMSYPNLDIRNLSQDDAKFIYKRDYWDRLELDELPSQLHYDMFDTAVNSGIGNSVRIFQRSVGAADDGWIGERTLGAAAVFSGEELHARFNGTRLDYYTHLSTWKTYGKGWTRRVAKILMRID